MAAKFQKMNPVAKAHMFAKRAFTAYKNLPNGPARDAAWEVYCKKNAEYHELLAASHVAHLPETE